MDKRILHIWWAAMYILCACLGFIQERSAGVQTVLTLVSLVFFAPPVCLLVQAARRKDGKELKLLRNLSLLSLGLTLFALVLAIATAPRGAAFAVNAVLTVVSVPMYCGKVWALSLLLWACLLLASMEVGKRAKE